MAKGTCTIPDCGSPTVGRGLCRKHYQRWWKRGTTDYAPGYAPRTLRERFDAKAVPGSGCWGWTGGHDANGYAKLSVDGATKNAHRIGYELYVGPIPDGLQIDHLCHTHDSSCMGGTTCPHRGCVNPQHLEPVTQRANVLRGEGPAGRNARRTHCKNDHEYNERNTRIGPRGNRMCRECERVRGVRRWSDNRDAMRAYDRDYRRKKRGA
jgi:hypothetical protein